MKKLILFLFCSSLLACTSSLKTATPSEKTYFTDTRGCFLLYNLKTEQFEKIIGEEICKTQFPAASTFKVPLSVMAFDAKILKDENQILKWDKKPKDLEAHNKDHNAKTWMSESVVWFSQELTPRLGRKEVQNYLNKFEYGNRDLRGGLTEAWLVLASGEKPALKISAYEQVEFMKKLWTNSLPASKRAMELTRQITYLETSPKGWALNGKTGSSFFDKEHLVHLGWFVSYLHHQDQEYIAVTVINDLEPKTPKSYGGPRAKALTKVILADHGLW